MPRLDGWLDPELEDLFRDQPELADTARLLHTSRPLAEADPHFRHQLRGHLMAEAERSLRRRRAWWRVGPAHAAWSGAAVGVVAVAAAVVSLLFGHAQDHQNLFASSNVAAQHAVSPADVITVAFNQPMNHQAVEKGVHIQPATTVNYSWRGNKLVITPVHHLVGNTPYTVTIAQPSIRASSGATAAAPIQITFGTAPTPPPGPSTPIPPRLAAAALGSAETGASVVVAPDGAVAVSSGLLPAATVEASPPPRPSSPSASPAAAGQLGVSIPAVIDFPAGGGAPVVRGPSATALAFAPAGSLLAMAVPNPDGGSLIEVAASNGGGTTVLGQAATTVTALAWTSNERLIFADGDAIKSVQLSGHQRILLTLPTASGEVDALSSSGYAFVAAPGSTGGGQLLNIAAGTSRLLSGVTAGGVAFSADGRTVAWIDAGGAGSRLVTEPVDRDTPASVSTLDPSAPTSDVALNVDGTEVAYVLSASTGAAQLVVAQLPSGAPLAVSPAGSAPAFAPSGGGFGFIASTPSGAQVERGMIPGSSAAARLAAPAAASSTLDAFVDAQVRGDRKALTALSGPGVDASARAPHRLSRAYIVSVSASSDGTVNATVELIVDPTGHHSTASVADERLALSPSTDGSTYLVVDIDTTSLHDQSSGPHVVRVSSSATGAFTLQISFDSDLDASSVPGAISVTSASGVATPISTTYDTSSRTATVTLASLPAGPLRVAVSTALRDIDGQALAAAFSATVAF